ncbi:MAG: hypothetical protein EG825_11090 [Rhodocyclaceae bacterium]|nr:hypothetical protein [Rhodocyclaceae bacterium]
MKIHQLPEGARFEYQGEEYVKTGPLLGTGKGGQRFIPKYAVLKPLGEVPVMEKKKAESLTRAEVVAAFEAFQIQCKALVPAERQEELESACCAFIDSLG